MSRYAREESGAQLLARLSSRPELSPIDPYIFGWQHTTPSSAAVALSSSHSIYNKNKVIAPVSGHLVEIYGPEGAGKTELALHYLARTCLPHTWKGVHIGGISAKAIVVDTDVKFSVLRLAVIMEKQIFALLQARNSPGKESYRSDPKSEGNSESIHKLPDTDRNEIKNENTNVFPGNVVQTDNSQTKGWDDQSVQVPAENGDNGYIHSTLTLLESSYVHTDTNCPVKNEESFVGVDDEIKLEGKDPDSLTSEDMESIVQESLERVQVVKPSNAQQLYMTLLSLEQALSCDLQTTLLLLDSVSSFFWEDRLAESAAYTWRLKSVAKGGSTVAGGMALVAVVVSRLVTELGMTVITTKAPLVGNASTSTTAGRKRKWRGDNEDSDAGKNTGSAYLSNASASSLAENGPEDDHVDFLGKAWSNLNPTRIVLTEESLLDIYCSSIASAVGEGKESSNAQRITTACCSLWPCKRRFTFIDDALQFL